MCLAVPGKVVEIYQENGLPMGKIDFSGTMNKACLAYVPEVTIGQYVIVHAGFAISVLDEEEAEQSFQVWDDFADRVRQEGYEVINKPFSKKKKNQRDNQN